MTVRFSIEGDSRATMAALECALHLCLFVVLVLFVFVLSILILLFVVLRLAEDRTAVLILLCFGEHLMDLISSHATSGLIVAGRSDERSLRSKSGREHERIDLVARLQAAMRTAKRVQRRFDALASFRRQRVVISRIRAAQSTRKARAKEEMRSAQQLKDQRVAETEARLCCLCCVRCELTLESPRTVVRRR